tara:strand:- start:188 stop:805 length:618 start_codon:yes stop_codon:yes gene_type:complete
MAYIGAEPSYGVFERQVITGDGTTTQYTLDHTVASPTQLLVVLGGIVQEPEYSYSTSTTSGVSKINFSEAPDNGDRGSIVYMGRQLLTAAATNSNTHINEFNGNGSTTAFTLTQVPASSSAENFMVFVDNVYQRHGTGLAYTVSGSTLTFSSAPPSGTKNIQVMQLNGVNTLNSVADGTISVAKVQQGVFDQAEDDATALAIALG